MYIFMLTNVIYLYLYYIIIIQRVYIVINHTYNYINYVKYNHMAEQIHQQLLDPIGTLCRLIEINFKSENTKITISNHALSTQDPQTLQWLVRKYNGHSKDNVSELFDVVVRVIYWYVIPLYKSNIIKRDDVSDKNIILTSNDKSSDDLVESSDIGDSCVMNNNENGEEMLDTNDIADTYVKCKFNEGDSKKYFNCIKRLIKYTCDALKMLQKTYKNGNVIMALQLYINILIDAVNGNFNIVHLPDCLTKKNIENGNFLDYSKICELWDYQKVKSICELYDRCIMEQTKKTSDNGEYIKGNIEGYLLAIDKMLSTRENEFRNLISSSNSG